jgi:hypothetical protein
MSDFVYTAIKTIQEAKGKEKLTFVRSLVETSSPEDIEELKTYLKYVYGTENWYQTQLNIPKAGETKSNNLFAMGKKKLTVNQAIEEFLSGTRRGNTGASRLSEIASRCTDDNQRELLQLALWHDLKAGFAPKSINKVFDNLIFIPPYQRLSTLDKGNHWGWDWTTGVAVQNKEDCMFGNLILRRKGNSALYSRNFNLIDSESIKSLTKYSEVFCNEVYGGDVVVMGELIVLDPEGKPYSREQNNGYINGVIQTGEELPEGTKLTMKCWDCVPYTDFIAGRCEIDYKTRLGDLQCALEMSGGNELQMVYTEIAHCIEDVRSLFSKVVSGRGEGVVIKNPWGIWENCDAGHVDAVKVKVQMDSVELKIVGINEADEKSRHVGTFASLQCESEDGLVVTGVAGMTDAMRDEINSHRDYYMGKVISARCNGIQYNPQAPHSLYFAQFVEVRTDKTVADTFERIESIQKSAIESKIMSKENGK